MLRICAEITTLADTVNISQMAFCKLTLCIAVWRDMVEQPEPRQCDDSRAILPAVPCVAALMIDKSVREANTSIMQLCWPCREYQLCHVCELS